MYVKFVIGANYYEPPTGVELAGRRRRFEHRGDLIELSVDQQIGALAGADVLLLTMAPEVARRIAAVLLRTLESESVSGEHGYEFCGEECDDDDDCRIVVEPGQEDED